MTELPLHGPAAMPLNSTPQPSHSPLLPSFPLYFRNRFSGHIVSNSAAMFSSLESLQLRPIETGFLLCDAQEPRVCSISGSCSTNPSPGFVQNRKKSKTVMSGCNGKSSYNSVVDERKRKRMMSNRESARRSRMRKQMHLEDLRNQLNRLRICNRELLNRILLAVHQVQLVRRENERLRSETVVLRRRLRDIRQELVDRRLQQHFVNLSAAWPCNNVTSINGQLPYCSLIR